MEAVLAPPTITARAPSRHLLLVLDGTSDDELLISLGAYSLAMTRGRVSLILLPGEPPAGTWSRRVSAGRRRAAGETRLDEAAARLRSMGARVDRILRGRQAAAGPMLDFIVESGVDVVAASSPPPVPVDGERRIAGSSAALALVPPPA